MELRQSEATFPDTMWSLVAHAENPSDPLCTKARENLARLYWPAVYAFLRRSGRTRTEAEELTQAFFADVVTGRALLAGANAQRGRLRTLVIAALKNYLIDVHRRHASRREDTTWSLDSVQFEHEEQRHATSTTELPESGFDRRWAAAIVSEALRRCQSHYEATGKASHWKLFERRIVRPLIHPADPPPLAAAAQELGFAAAADAAAAVQVVKKRFDALLREVIAESTAPGEDAEDEWTWLHRTLG